MKFKQECVLREVAGEHIVIPVVGLENQFKGIMTLNETAVFIWKQIEKEKEKEEIVAALLEEYDVEKEQAVRNVDNFCEQLEKLGIL